MDLRIQVEQVKATPVVRLEGEVDLYSSPKLRDELRRLVKAHPKVVVVDLGLVRYMDSSGLATLIEVVKRLSKSGGQLRLARPTATVSQVLKFSHLEQIFSIHEDLSGALQA